jgi:hypothetical protein
VVAFGGYKAYPSARAWWSARAVPADLRAYAQGKGVHYAPPGQGYSVRLPQRPERENVALGAPPALWRAIHRSDASGRDYRITIRVGVLMAGATLPFGLAGALADSRFGGTPTPHDLQLRAFDEKPAYEFHGDGARPIAGRVFRRGPRVYVVIVQSKGAARVLDTVLRSFTLAGE